MTRKYVILSSNKITTIPSDDYHSNVSTAIGGGWVTIINNSLVFYGRSESFGDPDLQLVKQCIQENFYTISNIVKHFKIQKIFVISGDIEGFDETMHSPIPFETL
jgi:hypothetical protein